MTPASNGGKKQKEAVMPVSQVVSSLDRVPQLRTEVRAVADELWSSKGYMSRTRRRRLASALYFLTDELVTHESVLWPNNPDEVHVPANL